MRTENFIMVLLWVQFTVGNLSHVSEDSSVMSHTANGDTKILQEDKALEPNHQIPAKTRRFSRGTHLEDINGEFCKSDLHESVHVTTKSSPEESDDIFMKYPDAVEKKGKHLIKPTGTVPAAAPDIENGERKADDESEKPYFASFVEVVAQEEATVLPPTKLTTGSMRSETSLHTAAKPKNSPSQPEFQLETEQIDENLLPPIALNSEHSAKYWRDKGGSSNKLNEFENTPTEPKLMKRQIDVNERKLNRVKKADGPEEEGSELLVLSLGGDVPQSNYSGNRVRSANVSPFESNNLTSFDEDASLVDTPANTFNIRPVIQNAKGTNKDTDYKRKIISDRINFYKNKMQGGGSDTVEENMLGKAEDGNKNNEETFIKWPKFEIESGRPLGYFNRSGPPEIETDKTQIVGQPVSKNEFKQDIYDYPGKPGKATDGILHKLSTTIINNAKTTSGNIKKRLGLCKLTKEPLTDTGKNEPDNDIKNVMSCLSTYVQGHTCPCVNPPIEVRDFLNWIVNGNSRVGCCLPGPSQRKSKYSFLFHDEPHAIHKGPCPTQSAALKSIQVIPVNCTSPAPNTGPQHAAQIVSDVRLHKQSPYLTLETYLNRHSLNQLDKDDHEGASPSPLDQRARGLSIQQPLQRYAPAGSDTSTHVRARQAKQENTGPDDSDYNTYVKQQIGKLFLFSGDDPAEDKPTNIEKQSKILHRYSNVG